MIQSEKSCPDDPRSEKQKILKSLYLSEYSTDSNNFRRVETGMCFLWLLNYFQNFRIGILPTMIVTTIHNWRFQNISNELNSIKRPKLTFGFFYLFWSLEILSRTPVPKEIVWNRLSFATKRALCVRILELVFSDFQRNAIRKKTKIDFHEKTFVLVIGNTLKNTSVKGNCLEWSELRY